MPLIDLWKSSPDTISAMNLEQILSIAGNGKLLDKSEASTELTSYLAQTSTERLGSYIQYCLANSFPQSGFALQDIINELGRRLEYIVTNGAYSGTKNRIGFDGIWNLSEGYSIIIEVKTTDAYRINLDTIANYRLKLIKEERITENSSILIVVGRQDTGDIEAQIRGSRHAWTIRMISAEALLKIVALKESSSDEEVLNKIRSLLVPFEYTRLDNIIDIVFTTANDSIVTDGPLSAFSEQSCLSPSSIKANKQNKTDISIIKSIRNEIIGHIGKNKSINLIARSRALYWTSDKNTRIACTISKSYPKNGGYWYALHKKWIDFLSESKDGAYVIGFVDARYYCEIPLNIAAALTSKLNKTDNDNNPFWHIIVNKTIDGFFLLIPGEGALSLAQYTHPY